MAYSTPLTAVSNTALTAAQWNASVRDNMLVTPAALATTSGRIFVSTGANAIAERAISSATTSASESTTSSTYTDLTTTGPEVASITTGTRALVFISADLTNNTLGGKAFMSVTVSGATTDAASDAQAVHFQAYGSNATARVGVLLPYTGLTPGSQTFTAKYRAATGTAGFSNRRITVVAL